jgi:hypothetical protein
MIANPRKEEEEKNFFARSMMEEIAFSLPLSPHPHNSSLTDAISSSE